MARWSSRCPRLRKGTSQRFFMARTILLLRAAGFVSFASKISGMLETTALACERGGLRLFADLSFALGPGGLLRVRGANGSGKTTLLRTLAGLTRPAAGSVRWRGNPIDDEYRKEMLFLGHAPAMKDELTVLENLEFSSKLSELKNSDCKKALEQLGVARLADLPARYLSQGQRRRAALARLALSAQRAAVAARRAVRRARCRGHRAAERAVRGAPRRRRHAGADLAPGRADRLAGAAGNRVAMTGFLAVLRRELQVALRRKGDALNVLVFFVIVASLFPLGVGPEPNLLRAMAAGRGLGRGAAGRDAVAAAPVRRRPRRRHAGADAGRAAAAGAARAGQDRRALARHGPAAGDRRAAASACSSTCRADALGRAARRRCCSARRC